MHNKFDNMECACAYACGCVFVCLICVCVFDKSKRIVNSRGLLVSERGEAAMDRR